MKCPSCHAANRDGAKFCDECGTPLAPPAAARVTAGSPAPDAGRSAEDLDAAGKTRVVRPDMPGIDECLIDSTYVPRSPNWRAGDTMEIPRVHDEDVRPPSAKAYRAPDGRPKRSAGKRAALAVLCLVIAGAAAGAVTYYFELWGGKAVPNVVGKTRTDAQYVLAEKGFSPRVLEVPSDETEGIVLLTDPAAGGRLEKGSEVVVHVSVMRTVPNVVGLPLDEAVALLAEEGFDQVATATEPSTEPEGTVLSMTPEGDAKARTSDEVSLVVAGPYTVPDVKGKTPQEASEALEGAGYAPTVAYVSDDSVADGTVLGTSPSAGSKLDPGSSVIVNVSRARGVELENAAWGFLIGLAETGEPLLVDGTAYTVLSVNSVEYLGNEVTSFSIQGIVSVVAPDGEVLTGSEKTVTGAMTWDANNYIVSVTAQAQ